MKILVVSCSPRTVSCSNSLADAFILGAKESGNEVKKFTLANKNINGCIACKYCFTHNGECSQKDDVAPIIDEMRKCDMLVLATPTYYYSLPSQTKAVLDRMYSRHGKALNIKYSALLIALADEEHAANVLRAQYKVAADYMGWKDLGIVCAGGMFSENISSNHPSIAKAYNLGKAISL